MFSDAGRKKKAAENGSEPEAATAVVKSNEEQVEEMFEKVAVSAEEVEEFLGPIKKLKSESSINCKREPPKRTYSGPRL